MDSRVEDQGFFRDFRIGLLRTLVRWVVRPTLIGESNANGDSLIFALYRRSDFDLALLHTVLRHSRDHSIESFYLLRPVGWRRRYTLRRFSPEIVEWQKEVLALPNSDAKVVPVSIFWGRTAQRQKFVWRNLISERYGPSFALRRILTLLFSRKDVLIDFGVPLDWNAISRRDKSLNWNLRHISVRLRRQFKQTRHATIGPDLYRLDHTVERIVDDVAGDLTDQQETVSARTRRKLGREVRKMATRMSYPAMMLVRRVLSWYFRRVYDGLQLTGRDRLQSIAKTHTLIYAPNHRSQTDYLVLSYLLFQHGFAIPQIASGDNLDIPVVGPLLRRCGAFFMRRSFREDPVYESVLKSYLHLCFEQGTSVEFFVEGGRSRTGSLLPPRFGLLSMVLASREKGLPRPIAVVPIYIAYESVPDTSAYLNELAGRPKNPESLQDVVMSLRLLRSRLGRVDVHIAEPIKLDTFVENSNLKLETERLGFAITHAINNAAILTPINLVALVVLTSPSHSIDEMTLIEHLAWLTRVLNVDSHRHDLVLPSESPQEMVDRCVLLNQIRRELDGSIQVITCEPEMAHSLTWFRNNSLHVVAIQGLIAAIHMNRELPLTVRETVEAVNFLVPFVTEQLSFGSSPRSIRRWIGCLEKLNLVQYTQGDMLQASQSPEERQILRLFAKFVQPMLNRFYTVLLTLLHYENDRVNIQSLVDRAHQSGRLLARVYGDESPYFIDRKFFETVAKSMLEFGVMQENQDKTVESTETALLVMEQARSVVPYDFRILAEKYVRR
ncbi:MAG: 1-acyl-sn-glycerol-3-phosphate acyltransferase [Gammaproteobacteria bacterium]|nr:1-acyl-sn-glycerol-3-phosphate acyltransferase [Gammaproteobacteria bacterium]